MEEDDVKTTTTCSQPDGTTASHCLSATVDGHAARSGVCLSLGVQLGRPCLTGELPDSGSGRDGIFLVGNKTRDKARSGQDGEPIAVAMITGGKRPKEIMSRGVVRKGTMKRRTGSGGFAWFVDMVMMTGRQGERCKRRCHEGRERQRLRMQRGQAMKR